LKDNKAVKWKEHFHERKYLGKELNEPIYSDYLISFSDHSENKVQQFIDYILRAVLRGFQPCFPKTPDTLPAILKESKYRSPIIVSVDGYSGPHVEVKHHIQPDTDTQRLKRTTAMKNLRAFIPHNAYNDDQDEDYHSGLKGADPDGAIWV
jgi:hypothetical protein